MFYCFVNVVFLTGFSIVFFGVFSLKSSSLKNRFWCLAQIPRIGLRGGWRHQIVQSRLLSSVKTVSEVQSSTPQLTRQSNGKITVGCFSCLKHFSQL